jgi:hypothetical protein
MCAPMCECAHMTTKPAATFTAEDFRRAAERYGPDAPQSDQRPVVTRATLNVALELYPDLDPDTFRIIE